MRPFMAIQEVTEIQHLFLTSLPGKLVAAAGSGPDAAQMKVTCENRFTESQEHSCRDEGEAQVSASRASVLLHAGSQGNKEKGEKLEDLKGVIKNK